MEKDLFSVVIPTYNRRHVISRAINSVLSQSYRNIELIVVDDGSEDDTKGLFIDNKEFESILYHYVNHGGAQKARNAGLNLAHGEYVLFLDSDDELLPTCIDMMVNEYNSDHSIDSVYGLTGLKNADGSLRLARNDFLKGNVYKEVLEQGYLTSSSFISMRRSIFKEIGDWDELLPSSQDDDMCFRIAKNFKIGFIDEIIGIYGVGAGNQIGGSRKRVATGWWMLWNKYEKDVISYCGKDVLIKHFKECAERFKIEKMDVEYNEVVKKLYSIIGDNS